MKCFKRSVLAQITLSRESTFWVRQSAGINSHECTWSVSRCSFHSVIISVCLLLVCHTHPVLFWAVARFLCQILVVGKEILLEGLYANLNMI